MLFVFIDLLEVLTTWISKNHEVCRSQDLVSFFLTMAVLNYKPHQFDAIFSMVVPHLTYIEIGKPILWLEFVWALVILNKASVPHIASVLSKNFISSVTKGTTSHK